MLDFDHPHGCRWAGAYSSCMETAEDWVQPVTGLEDRDKETDNHSDIRGI